MSEITRIQACARRYLHRRIVSLPGTQLLPCKASKFVPDGVPVEKALSLFLYDLVMRRADFCGVKLNAPTVLSLMKNQRVKFASYRRHRDDPVGVLSAYNYVWLRQEVQEGSVPVELPCQRRQRLAQLGPKKPCRRGQPIFLQPDILSTVAKFLPVQGWGALTCVCHGSGFTVARNYLRKQMVCRLGHVPKDPYKALLMYSAARGQTPWQHKKEVVFSFDATWSTSARHSHYDRILHMWSSSVNNVTQVNFVTAHGMCGTYRDVANAIVSVSRMAPVSNSFRVTHVAVGHDGSIAVVHNRGISIYSNKTKEKSVHVHYPSASTSEIACVNEHNVFFVHGTRRKRLGLVCFRCSHGAHTSAFPESGCTFHQVSMLKTTKTGVVWRAGNLRLCRVGIDERDAEEIQPRLHGRGRICYISDMLPTGVNAVLQAVGPDVTRISLTNGKNWLRAINCDSTQPKIFANISNGFSTVGDMICYHERLTGRHVAIRPETDDKIDVAQLPFSQSTKYNAKQMYLMNGSVFVIENGKRLVKYSV